MHLSSIQIQSSCQSQMTSSIHCSKALCSDMEAAKATSEREVAGSTGDKMKAISPNSLLVSKDSISNSNSNSSRAWTATWCKTRAVNSRWWTTKTTIMLTWEAKGKTNSSNNSMWAVEAELVVSSRTMETIISSSSSSSNSDKWVVRIVTTLKAKDRASRQINSSSNRTTTPVRAASSSRCHQIKPILHPITNSNSKWTVIFRIVGWEKCSSSLATSVEALSFLWVREIRNK